MYQALRCLRYSVWGLKVLKEPGLAIGYEKFLGLPVPLCLSRLIVVCACVCGVCGDKQDPVAHTLVQGKRLLCNDMWGLGLITLSLVVGYTEMEAIKSSLRKLGIPESERGSEGAREGEGGRGAGGS